MWASIEPLFRWIERQRIAKCSSLIETDSLWLSLFYDKDRISFQKRHVLHEYRRTTFHGSNQRAQFMISLIRPWFGENIDRSTLDRSEILFFVYLRSSFSITHCFQHFLFFVEHRNRFCQENVRQNEIDRKSRRIEQRRKKWNELRFDSGDI